MDAPSLQTLASHWLCHSAKEGQTRCQSDKDYVWCRLLDRSQACCQQTQPAHSACTTTTRKESAKEIGCIQAEARQQEANIHQRSLQLFRCTGTQFKRCTWELDSPHSSVMDSLRTVSRKHQDWLRMTKKSRNSLKRNYKSTMLTSEIPAQYLVRLPIQTYARKYRLGSETYKTPGWAKKADEIQSFADRKVIWSSLMHLRQYIVPRAQNHPTH